VQDIPASYESPSLSRHCPREIMTGLKRTNVLDMVIYTPDTKKVVHYEVTKEVLDTHVDKLALSLADMHGKVKLSTERRRKSNRKQQAKHSTIGRFTVGCYVLNAMVIKKVSNKLHVKWMGPYRVTKCIFDQVYEVQHLIDSSIILEAHALRLKYYSHPPDMEITEILIDNIKFQDSIRYRIKDILEHRYNASTASYEYLVQWQGFSTLENSWEPFETIFTDAPLVIRKYVMKLSKTAENLDLIEYMKEV
jgi:hypothetical protein